MAKKKAAKKGDKCPGCGIIRGPGKRHADDCPYRGRKSRKGKRRATVKADGGFDMATLKGCDAAELLRIRDKVNDLLQGKVTELEGQLKEIKDRCQQPNKRKGRQ